MPAARKQSVGGAAEEQVVEELLIAACELVQLAGNGESDQEIGTGEQQMLLAVQPLGSIGVSALGAVPVVTAMVTVIGALTGGAVVNAATQQRRAARKDIAHDTPVAGQDVLAKALQIGRPIPAENLRQFGHGQYGCAGALQVGDHPVEPLGGLFLYHFGEVGVERRSLRGLMAQVVLNLPEVLATLEQMGGVGMTQGMDMCLFAASGGLQSQPEGPLQAGS